MKKFFCLIISILTIFLTKSNTEVQSQYLNRSYIVLDATNNKVIEGKEINLIRSVASVSKIMTGIIALEKGDLNKEVEITKEDVDTYGSSIYLQVGDKVPIIDLIYGLMLRSGNDAAKTIARVVGGSVENFATLMNEKAKEIGMNNSTFTNPSGLDVEETGNLSTSYDLALLMSYAIKNEMFLKISGAKEYKSYKGIWANKNKLLHSYKNTIAGKTGFTYKAKRTLVTAAREEETTLVVVSLDCGNDFNFHKFLYEKNFKKYLSKLVLSKGDNYFEDYLVTCNQDIYLTLEKDKLKEYTIVHYLNENDTTIYLVDAFNNKQEIGKCKSEKIENKKEKSFWQKIKEIFK